MLHGVAVCDGKVLLDPGVEFGHVADLGIIVKDDVGLLFRQKRIVLFKRGSLSVPEMTDACATVSVPSAIRKPRPCCSPMAWSTLLPA